MKTSKYYHKQYTVETVDDGPYKAHIVEVDGGRSSAGHFTASWVLKIQGGEFDGKLVLARFNLSTQESVGYHKSRLRECGLEVADRIEFAQKKHLLVGKIVDIVAYTNEQGYQSYRISRPCSEIDFQVDPELKW